jgi:hypothetical protein
VRNVSYDSPLTKRAMATVARPSSPCKINAPRNSGDASLDVKSSTMFGTGCSNCSYTNVSCDAGSIAGLPTDATTS